MKTLAVLLASASALVLAHAVHADDAPAAPAKDYTILKVDGDEVKKSEVDTMWQSLFPSGHAPDFDTFDPKVRDNVLRGVASEHVLLRQAEKSGIPDQPDVKARLEAARHQIIIQEFLKDKTKDLVSDAKLKEVYDEKMKNATGGAEEVRARHILVKTEAEAKAIEKKLKKGGDFEKIAKEESEDKTSGASGGELGWFTQDKMVPEFAKVAFTLKKGEISDPVHTDFGWHIIQVEDRRKSPPPSFEESKDTLRQEVGNKAVAGYVNNLMQNVKVVELDPSGKEKPLPNKPVPGLSDPDASSATPDDAGKK